MGAGARAGVWCGGLTRGRCLLPGLPPPTHSPPPGGSSLRTGQSREVAGRGLLASCLLSRGLISKTGRLVLTEAADGTAYAPARLSSWGPDPAPVGCSQTLPSNARATTSPSPSPWAAPRDACQALHSPTAGRSGAGGVGVCRKVGGLRGCGLTGLVGRVSRSHFQMRKLRLREGSELTCVTQWWWWGLPQCPPPRFQNALGCGAVHHHRLTSRAAGPLQGPG